MSRIPPRLLAKLDRPVVAVVASGWISPEVATLAQARGVWQVLDGQAIPPGTA